MKEKTLSKPQTKKKASQHPNFKPVPNAKGGFILLGVIIIILIALIGQYVAAAIILFTVGWIAGWIVKKIDQRRGI